MFLNQFADPVWTNLAFETKGNKNKTKKKKTTHVGSFGDLVVLIILSSKNRGGTWNEIVGQRLEEPFQAVERLNIWRRARKRDRGTVSRKVSRRGAIRGTFGYTSDGIYRLICRAGDSSHVLHDGRERSRLSERRLAGFRDPPCATALRETPNSLPPP